MTAGQVAVLVWALTMIPAALAADIITRRIRPGLIARPLLVHAALVALAPLTLAAVVAVAFLPERSPR